MLTTLSNPLPLANLPRDTRDTLFLLAVVGWVAFMQMGHIPWWCSALAAGVLLWRARLALRGLPLPAWYWRAGLLGITLVATWFTHKTLLGRDAGVTLIVVLLALKTLEMRARRDAFVVFFLAFFTLLTHFFYSQSLLTAAGILLALLGLLTALVNAHMPVGRPSLWRAARTAGGMALMGAPVMLVLFMLFPRFAPLWGVPSDAMTGRTGLSDRMKIGDVASLMQLDEIALRVRFDNQPPPLGTLYFRGPVFSDFDGREWRTLRSGFPESLQLPANLGVRGEAVRYEVIQEPTNQPWLMVLEATPRAPEIVGSTPYITPDLQWRVRRPLNDLVRYRAESFPDFRHGPLEPVIGLQDYLQLPGGFNPRTLELAQNLRRQYGAGPQNNQALVNAALAQLRTGGYTYTVDPGVYGLHTADEFWFDRKEGFCEHIASAFVILMRAMDIPARIVTGYQGGELNTVDNYWTVRQRDAHAWTEVWFAGQGWVRIDPTAAVADWRIGSLDRLQPDEGAIASAFRNLNPTLATQLRNFWEAVNTRWNQWILNYTQGRQLELLKSLGFESPRWTDLAYALLGVLVVVSLVGAAWTLWERQQHDPWLRLLQQARARLARQGLRGTDHLPPRALAKAVEQGFTGADTTALTRWLLRLEALRYSKASPDSLATLKAEFRQLAWPAGKVNEG